ncbi:MAG: phage tail protein [Alistipes sp.]|nr:phage tail protein [Alistipes sp.]
MADDRAIASSLSDNELAVAVSDMVADRWDNWDLAPYLALLVDVCAPSVLPYLAEMFDVEGLQGFAVAENEQQQREIIKRSIALHKYMGTPWAIREACRTVGFPVSVLEEGVTAEPGGEVSPLDWARFRVLVDAEQNRHITEEDARKLRQFVEYYKNERSHLVELGFYQSFEDKIFRRPVEERDTLELQILSLVLSAKVIALSPAGTAKSVAVASDCPWSLGGVAFEWPDGSGDKIYLQYTGQPGNSEIIATADYNRTGADRSVIFEIYYTDGMLLGTLTIEQVYRWRNAYSRAYSRAYNLLPKKINAYSGAYSKAYSNVTPYVNIPVEAVFLSEAVPDYDVPVVSNTNWKTE